MRGVDDSGLTLIQPYSLYVHVPFCHSKCAYCDFYSVAREGHDVDELIRGVARELGERLRDKPDNLRTVFIGACTVSAIS